MRGQAGVVHQTLVSGRFYRLDTKVSSRPSSDGSGAARIARRLRLPTGTMVSWTPSS